MNKIKLRTASIAVASLLTAHALWNLLMFYQIKLSMASPLIPDHIIGEFTQPYLKTTFLLISAVGLSLPFFFKSRYTVTIGICVAAIVIELFL